MAIVERLLMLVDRVVHFPESALRGGSLRGLCRVLGVWMALAEREVPKHEAELRSKTPLNFLDDGVRPPAMRAFVVAVFNQRDGGVGRTLRVIARADRHRQACDVFVSHASPQLSALRVPAGCRRHRD